MIPACDNTPNTRISTTSNGLATLWQGFFVRPPNKVIILNIGFLIAFTIFFVSAIPTAKAEDADFFEKQKITSHLLINLFLQKLDQGGLVIFEQVIRRADLQSHQVAYVHNLVDDSLIVRLCFKLQKKILVPKFENFYVDGVTIETDKMGNIIQVKTHVSPIRTNKPEQ